MTDVLSFTGARTLLRVKGCQWGGQGVSKGSQKEAQTWKLAGTNMKIKHIYIQQYNNRVDVRAQLYYYYINFKRQLLYKVS